MPEELLNFSREDMNVPIGIVRSFIRRCLPFPPFSTASSIWHSTKQGWAWDKAIVRILNSRTGSNLHQVADPELRALTEEIVAIVVELMQWPNRYFYQEDKVRCLIGWDTGDLCELECMQEICDTYNIPMGADYDDLDTPVIDLTIVEFAEWIRKHRQDSPAEPAGNEPSRPA